MYSIGIDLGGTSAQVVAVKKDKILFQTSILVRDNSSLQYILDDLSSCIEKFRVGRPEPLVSIGIAFPSIVDAPNNKILSQYVKYPDAVDFDLENWAKIKFGAALFLENDARAALIGEYHFGFAKGYENSCVLTLGTGIGSAIMLDGKLLRGSNQLAGNLLGHTIIQYDGGKCNCNGIGCAESEGSGWWLNNKFHEINRGDLCGQGFKALLEPENIRSPVFQEILAQLIKVYKTIMINAVHCYDPEIIILGGGIAEGMNTYIPVFQKAIEQHCWIPPGTVKIMKSSLGIYAGAIGAACLYLNRDSKTPLNAT